MHKSRICAIGIDCLTDDVNAAADFWTRALGRPRGGAEGPYVQVGNGKEALITFVQKVDHPSRIHLDIETDDVDAEVARLEALGAKRLQKVKSWWVLEAPTGHRFCVVRAQDHEGPAWNEWP
jgi:hypothetical protein